jgi:hypothetical protein
MGLSRRLSELKAKQQQEQAALEAKGTVFHMEDPPEEMRARAQLAQEWYNRGCDPKVVGCLIYQGGTMLAFLSEVEALILHLQEGSKNGLTMYKEFMADQLRNIPNGPMKRMAIYVCITAEEGTTTAAVAYISISRGN